MRPLVLSLALLSGATSAAEPVDCDAILNGTVAVEFSYHDAGETAVLQIYRDTSSGSVVWLKTLNGKLVAKAVFVDGLLTASETTSAYAGKFKSSKAKFDHEGMPKQFDRRSDLKYSTTSSVAYADGSTNASTTTSDYKFKSAGKESVGPCTLDVVRGETVGVNDKTGKTSRTYSLYFPQVGATLIGHSAEPVVDEIKTTFDPMTPIP